MFAYKREILSAKSESLLKFEITVTPFLFRLDELKEERRQESPLARARTHTQQTSPVDVGYGAGRGEP